MMKALHKGNAKNERRSGRMRAWRSAPSSRPRGPCRGRLADPLRQAARSAALLTAFCLASATQALAAGAEPNAAQAVERSAEELETLVAPVALYPDDLLAVVLPAATYPLQVVQATRFLEARKKDAQAKPDEAWNEAVVALLNYPEALELLNDDLDWTWRLGEAVLAQEEAVIAAVGAFREKAQSAGNLESDRKQEVAIEDGAIRIKSTSPTRIHVPYYEPAEVVVRQPYRVYHYYPRAYPVYYYPYRRHHPFHDDLFWGVTSAFSIGWSTGRLHWHHYGFHDHPYFGYRYYDPFYYRRPHLYLSLRERNHRHRNERHHDRNRWRPDGRRHGARPHRQDRWAKAHDPDRRRPDNHRHRDRRAENQQPGHRRDADRYDRSDRRRREPADRTAAIGDPAVPAGRPVARTVHTSPYARANGERPTIHAPTEVRTLPREAIRRPHPLGRGGGATNAGQARQRSASAPPRPAVRPTQRQRRPIQAPRAGTRPAAGDLRRAPPAQVQRRPSTVNPPVAQPTPRPNPAWRVRPGTGASSPEALSKQIQRPSPPVQAKRTRKDVDHQ